MLGGVVRGDGEEEACRKTRNATTRAVAHGAQNGAQTQRPVEDAEGHHAVTAALLVCLNQLTNKYHHTLHAQ